MTDTIVRCQSLGRETPLALQLLSYSKDALELLVSYRDGLEIYRGNHQAVTTVQGTELPVEVAKALPQRVGDPAVFLVGGQRLSLLGSDLACSAQADTPEGESFRALIPLTPERFLSLAEDDSVHFWSLDTEGSPSVQARWLAGCTPLLGRPGGKSVVVVEEGRLQERDPRNGTLLKTWPKGSAPVMSAFQDAQGHSLVSLDEHGQAQLWDAHSREPLLIFNTPLAIVHGAFSQDGSQGALLSGDGDLLTFQLTGGGSTQVLPPMPVPIIDIVWAGPHLIGLDENGGIWRISSDPELIGGAWAGWTTCGLALQDGRTVVGTAHGEILLYGPERAESPVWRRLQGDAVLALFETERALLCVSADGEVVSLPLDDLTASEPREVASFSGESVVGCHLESDRSRLWVALEEGKIAWLDPLTGDLLGQYHFPEHRIEEIRAGAHRGELLVLTDRGSLKRLRVE